MAKTNQGFIEAIISEPDEDAHRLIYADWLDDHDDPRGEFIRVQFELAKDRLPKGRRADLKRSERVLFEAYNPEWVAGLWETRFSVNDTCIPCHTLLRNFHKGFLEFINSRADYFLEHGPALLACEPIRSIGFAGNGLGQNGVVPILPFLSRIERLNLNNNPILAATGIEALVDSPNVANLKTLLLTGCRLDARAMRALAGSSCLGRLERLDLQSNPLENAGVITLVSSPHLKIKNLNLSYTGISSQAIHALSTSDFAKHLRELDIRNINNPIASLCHIAVSENLKGLNRLEIGTCNNREILTALLRSQNLLNLKLLDAWTNPLPMDALIEFINRERRAGHPGLPSLSIFNDDSIKGHCQRNKIELVPPPFQFRPENQHGREGRKRG